MILALDLEGTLIKDRLEPIPRPGLQEFLDWVRPRFEVVIFTTLPREEFHRIATNLAKNGSAPAWFPNLPHLQKTREDQHKDLQRLGDPKKILLVDDYEGYVAPSQRERWLPIETYFDQGNDDRELDRIRELLSVIYEQQP